MFECYHGNWLYSSVKANSHSYIQIQKTGIIAFIIVCEKLPSTTKLLTTNVHDQQQNE